MRIMGLVAVVLSSNTSGTHPEYKVYPYLLRRVAVVRPSQMWSTYIKYTRLLRGFVYLVAIIGGYSHRIMLGWQNSNSMEATFCGDLLEETIRSHDKPEIFNIDQGSQFTSDTFTGVLQRKGIVISMGGAMILNKYPRAKKDEKSETETGKQPISNVKAEEKAKEKLGQRCPVASEVACTS